MIDVMKQSFRPEVLASVLGSNRNFFIFSFLFECESRAASDDLLIMVERILSIEIRSIIDRALEPFNYQCTCLLIETSDAD